MKQIPLSRGLFTTVDDEDFDRLSRHRWHANAYGYAVRFIGRSVVWMHREIMEAPKEMTVDHINRQKADNRRANLRLCTHQANCANKISRRGMLMGVGFHKASGKWRAYIRVNYKQMEVGHFDTQEAAMAARLEAERFYFGEFAPNRDVA